MTEAPVLGGSSPLSSRRLSACLLVAVLGAWLGGGCSAPGDDVAAEGRFDRECRDGVDNDGDGAVDCDDDGCAWVGVCSVPGADGGGGGRDADGDATNDAGPDVGADVEDEPDGAVGDGDVDEAGSESDADDAADGPLDGDADVPDAPDEDVGVGGPPTRTCLTHIEHSAPGATSVRIAGPFTNWGTSPVALASLGGGRFGVDLDLPPGEHPYKFIVDGVWEWDGTAEIPSPAPFYTQWVGDSENRNVIVGDCHAPRLETVAASGGSDGVTATFRFWRGVDGSPLDEDSVRVTVGGEPAEASFDGETGLLTVDVSGLPDGKHSIRVWADDATGRSIEDAPAFVPLWVERSPFEWQDATMYFVFTDRFRNSDEGAATPIAVPIEGVPEIANYQGGDFRGVTEAIEEGYFDDLGANLLWLSPIQENPEGPWLAADGFHQFSGFHGYWPTHGRQVEYRWGDVGGDAATRLRELIDTAHAHGIRVLFDIPLNHVHQDHEYRAAHPEWFSAAPCPCNNDASSTCGWDNPIGQLMCWFTSYLPDLDYRKHAIVEQMASDVEWLVTEFDVDGFRVDAAKHMHHVIMRRVALRLDERFVAGGGAPFYLVGETFTGGDGHGLIMRYVNDAELDGQFDFPLLYPIRDAFAGSGSFRTLAERRAVSEAQYGSAYEWMSPFLGNHDIPRFAARVFGEPGAWDGAPDPMDRGLDTQTWELVNRLSLGFLFVLTQPGIPLIYYGDEIGMFGGGDPDNRRFMKWAPDLSDAQTTLLGRVGTIGRARQELDALRRGDYRELWVDDTFYVYARALPGGDVAVIAMNKGDAGSRNMPVPADLGLNGETLTDVLGGSRTMRVSAGNATVTLNAWEYAIFAP
ncbi:MAG: hypothetical protein H6698_08135 [Myxococcales bacterium]|nr:hypothetical protein [Myxococcales bacterium]MCB9534257.1 hypothetical protein [Myxococcales bacterium]